MKNGCGCLGKPQKREKPLDEALAEAVASGKRERQAVLQRVRRRRAIVFKRMAAKFESGPVWNDVQHVKERLR